MSWFENYRRASLVLQAGSAKWFAMHDGPLKGWVDASSARRGAGCALLVQTGPGLIVVGGVTSQRVSSDAHILQCLPDVRSAVQQLSRGTRGPLGMQWQLRLHVVMTLR